MKINPLTRDARISVAILWVSSRRAPEHMLIGSCKPGPRRGCWATSRHMKMSSQLPSSIWIQGQQI
ncbi:kynureninase [Histoplasma capsulatum]|uniref:Kynureninase n=1 Tax=Ajellomyces capsulatus TaxID=5037 RepID=A0A8A1MC23_AJECA|nr:kynureninase [Histoplasma capsulatum]